MARHDNNISRLSRNNLFNREHLFSLRRTPTQRECFRHDADVGERGRGRSDTITTTTTAAKESRVKGNPLFSGPALPPPSPARPSPFFFLNMRDHQSSSLAPTGSTTPRAIDKRKFTGQRRHLEAREKDGRERTRGRGSEREIKRKNGEQKEGHVEREERRERVEAGLSP